ncbi:MAG: carbohydrate kinase [Treponema sp.]|jgi:fructokinase|nr:carbohydrate kinase [Treponema sp.]
MILCTGEAVIDMIQTHIAGLGEVFLPLPGGCAYNTSIAIGRLGVPAAFLGRLSTNFFGEMQITRLRQNNVKDNLLIRCEQNPVLAFIKVEEDKEPEYAFYEEGTADRLLSPEELPAIPPDTTCIVFGSVSMAMEPIASTIENLIIKEAENKKVIAFDPNIRPIFIKDRDAYLKRFEKWVGVSTIVKISLEDFEYILPNPDPQQALEKLISMGTRLAIITLGPQGAIAMLKRDNGSVISVSAPAEKIPKVADTVGAGDTFHGAFLSWLEMKDKMSHDAIAALSENDLYNALVFANKAATVVCTRHGAEPPTLGELPLT